jgi:hypothetical protein
MTYERKSTGRIAYATRQKWEVLAAGIFAVRRNLMKPSRRVHTLTFWL